MEFFKKASSQNGIANKGGLDNKYLIWGDHMGFSNIMDLSGDHKDWALKPMCKL